MHHTKTCLYLALFFLMGACDNRFELRPTCIDLPASFTPTNAQALFLEIAFDQEFGQASERLRKWNSPIYIFIDGNPSDQILQEVEVVITELVALSTEIPIVEVDTREEANLILFLGAKEDYIELIEPGAAGIANGNSGFATIAWNTNYEIIRASACVDIVNFSGTEFIKHVVREEMAQTLGLINDTEEDPNSIFYQFANAATAYSKTDEQLITYMLGEELKAGMCKTEALGVVE